MKHSSSLRSLVPIYCALLCGQFVGSGVAHSKPTSRVYGAQASKEKSAVLRALSRELSRQTTDHPKVSSYTVSRFDVDSNYAFMKVEPARPLELDPVFVLMRKRGGQWKFVTLGTAMKGVGKQFGVPRRLWGKWGL